MQTFNEKWILTAKAGPVLPERSQEKKKIPFIWRHAAAYVLHEFRDPVCRVTCLAVSSLRETNVIIR